jgi:hypothetical protein
LAFPYQVFVVVPPIANGGVAMIAGYSTGGPLSYLDISSAPASVSNAMIFAEIARNIPAGTVAWVGIES